MKTIMLAVAAFAMTLFLAVSNAWAVPCPNLRRDPACGYTSRFEETPARPIFPYANQAIPVTAKPTPITSSRAPAAARGAR